MDEELTQLQQRRRLEVDIRRVEAPLMSSASIRRLQARERERLEEDQAALRLERALNAADAKSERKQKREKALVEQGRRECRLEVQKRLDAQRWSLMSLLALAALAHLMQGVSPWNVFSELVLLWAFQRVFVE